MKDIQSQNLPNITVLYGNINVHIETIIQSLPTSMPISGISIFHPDPWFKARHAKRRVVTDAFVEKLGQLVPSGTPLYLQTDVLELFHVMIETVENTSATVDQRGFRRAPDRAFPIEFQESPTDREITVRAEQGHIYQCVFEKV